MMQNKKGQLSIINIMFYVILVVVSAVVTPIMSNIISTTITDNNITGLTALVMNAIIPFYWLGIVITFFIYLQPIRIQQ